MGKLDVPSISLQDKKLAEKIKSVLDDKYDVIEMVVNYNDNTTEMFNVIVLKNDNFTTNI